MMTEKDKVIRKMKSLIRKFERLTEIVRKQKSGKPLSKKDRRSLGFK